MKNHKRLLPKFLLGLLCCSSVMVLSAQAATDAQAKAITAAYQAAYDQWARELESATDVRSREAVLQKRPDPRTYAHKLKNLLRSDLANDWSLKYGAWLLENDYDISPESQRALLNAVEKYHLKSPELGPFCISMVHLNQRGEQPRPGTIPLESRGMKLLEEIKKQNPKPEVQGQAALAISIMLGGLGDHGNIMRQRMTNLKEAIIKSADVRIGDITVADVARDELYKITHLTKGRIAPEISGLDSASRPLTLSSFRGKVVMLVFWSSWDKDTARLLPMLRKSVESQAGKPFVVLGVNRDTLANLRALEGDRLVTWRNFSDPQQDISKAYRIASWPYCLVLDQEGAIAYRGAPGSFADAVANNLLLTESSAPATQPE
ncbi:TlpA family protein disulfide reductase [Verrucomicrobiaceae bacterium 5K15]|uniref:TlpA family protein disulfide reductase n=1 Tax=Oceaniferula flava TaxID=2800421 RepID=A0AAE2VC65_9BACT|nr:TlpA disulfide reductase family protein [Oceaniferula flavus]MBK1854651.1 TlpA family protein disulfide reductase [Oceaniferula flavus]MBM1135957.1 TlpA family protein disulfide reductase [Oceaniferula flavus]